MVSTASAYQTHYLQRLCGALKVHKTAIWARTRRHPETDSRRPDAHFNMQWWPQGGHWSAQTVAGSYAPRTGLIDSAVLSCKGVTRDDVHDDSEDSNGESERVAGSTKVRTNPP